MKKSQKANQTHTPQKKKSSMSKVVIYLMIFAMLASTLLVGISMFI